MQSLVIRFTKDVTPTHAYVLNIPVEYSSADNFLIAYLAWCVDTTVSEFGFLGLGLQPHHSLTLEVLSLEEWFWKYKKTIAP